MKRIFIIIVAALLLSVTAKNSHAQDLKIGLTFGNINLDGLKQYKGNDFFINTDWKSGRAFGITVKYSFEYLPLRLNADFLYSAMDGAGFYFVIDPAANSVPVPVDTKTDMFYTNLGAEWRIIDGRFSPYIGTALNFLSVADIEIGSRYIDRIIFDEGEYLGGGVKAGSEIRLVDYLMLDLSIHYIDFDLFLRSKDARDDLSSVNLMATIFVNL